MTTTIKKKSTIKKLSLIKNLSFLAFSAVLCFGFATEGWAQSATKSEGYGSAVLKNLQSGNSVARFSVGNIRNSLRNRSASIVGIAGVNQRNFLGSGSTSLARPSKPFSSVTRGPTVSPYLSLSSRGASASSYQSLIRPQQQQQQADRRQQAFAVQRMHRLNQMAAKAPYSSKGDDKRAPTGHAAVFQSLGSFQNTAQYFPPPSRPKQRR